jgi:transcriptional regulator with XRE-family HTH domain
MKRLQLAQLLGMSPTTLSDWELGHKEPDATQRVRLAVALDVPENELFGDAPVARGPASVVYLPLPSLRCGCGEEFRGIAALGTHTYLSHRRIPTDTERLPVGPELISD